MNNIKIDDNNLSVSYLQGILKQFYSSQVILSNNYDYNTHQRLIDFLSSYIYTKNRDVIKILINDETLVDDENNNIFKKYFSVSDDVSYITLKVKNKDKVKEYFSSNFNAKRRYLIKLLKSYGWIISKFNLYSKDNQYIIIQSLYPDLGIVKEDILKMINLYNEHRIISKYKLDGTGIVYDTNYKLLLLNYNQETIYTICSKNFSNNNMRVALTVKSYNDIITDIANNDFELYDDLEYTGQLGVTFDTTDFNKYEALLDENPQYTEYQTMIIELPYNYSNTLLILESSIDNLLDTNLKVNDSNFLSEFYFNNPWLVNKELIQIFLGNTINQYSSEENIKYIQNIYKYINMEYNNKLDRHEISYGVYDNELKEGIKQIQKLNNVLYCNGTVNTETEELLLRGSEE